MLIVRALAAGDVARSDWGRMLVREAPIGFALGVTMALAVSVIGVLRAGPDGALAVALSMVLIVLTGVAIGGLAVPLAVALRP